ncbi:MAG: DUF2797 domain-containing protein [Candidatus Aenigmatarchaeota archaeon]
MKQIIGYKWKKWKPTLVINNGSKMELELLNQRVDFTFGKLFCTGFNKNGKHFDCSTTMEIASGYQCKHCAIRDDFTKCVHCNGNACANDKQRSSCFSNSYYVYLAGFGSLLKVGMSFEYRFLQRFVEQGADFAARVAYVKDGRNARKTEQLIKNTLKLTDRVLGAQKHNELFADPTITMQNMQNAIAMLKQCKFNYLIEPDIFDLRAYYNLDKLLEKPEAFDVKENTTLAGEVVAAKGNLVFVKNENGFLSVNAHRLVGRELIA